MKPIDKLYQVAGFLLDCACDALADTDGGCPARRCVVPGIEAEAVNCCEGQGQLTVNLISVFPSRSFPAPDPAADNCDTPITAAAYQIEVFRCMPTGDVERAPSCDALDDTALLTMVDIAAVRKGVTCCLRDESQAVPVLGRGYRWVLGNHFPIGRPDEMGGCVGTRLELTVGWLTCWDCNGD